MRKRKKTYKDFEFLPDPVWTEVDGVIKPTPFFLSWWQDVAERRFGDRERWLDAAIELGYIIKFYDKEIGTSCYDLMGFDYNPALYRASLNISEDMPLVSQNDRCSEDYQRLWQRLLSPEKEVRLNGE
ncbi:hypothetical protein ACFLWG_02295 [Chloroflexota bacterium]